MKVNYRTLAERKKKKGDREKVQGKGNGKFKKTETETILNNTGNSARLSSPQMYMPWSEPETRIMDPLFLVICTCHVPSLMPASYSLASQ